VEGENEANSLKVETADRNFPGEDDFETDYGASSIRLSVSLNYVCLQKSDKYTVSKQF
jgi:hypothetical protein